MNFRVVAILLFSLLASACSISPRNEYRYQAADIGTPQISLSELGGMNQAELDALYQLGKADEFPAGKGEGLAMMFPSLWFNELRSFFLSWGWQGKTIFSEKHGTIDGTNVVFGFESIPFTVYKDASYFDGRPSVIIDYRNSTFGFRHVRDEIRRVGNNVWLGRAYYRTWGDIFGKVMFINFALDFNKPYNKPTTKNGD